MTLTLTATAQESDRDAVVLTSPPFVLTDEAKAAGFDGSVTISVKVDKTGAVKDATVIGGPAWPCGRDPGPEVLSRFRQAVKDVVRSTKFLPAIRKGKPADTEMLLKFNIGEAYEREIDKRKRDEAIQAGTPKIVRAGVLNGKALKLPKPDLPMEARSMHAGGTVPIEVTIDETGKVILAGPVSGHPLLQKAARDSACGAKFSPTMLSGVPVKVMGVITYTFIL